MSTRVKVIVLESCQAAPPPRTVSEMSHSLTFSDMMFVGISLVRRLIFYDNPVSKVHFIDNIIPNLRHSLSHALKYFPSLAGKCLLPTDSKQPEIRYSEGDSVSLVFAESGFLDLDYLVSDQPRICSEFYPYLPRLAPESTDSGRARIFPILAVQVTVFPGSGFCIGIEYQHVAADGFAMYAFMKTWALISNLGEHETTSIGNELVPLYDREVIKDHTKGLDDLFWNHLRNTFGKKGIFDIKYRQPNPDLVRSTFVISSDDVQRLKNYATNKRQPQKHLSTFIVVCGYLWTCMVKVNNNVNVDEADSDETEHFCCPMDFRGRVEPPIPSNYFGNCIVQCITSAKNGELSSDDGFLIAVERIGDSIEKRCQGVLKGIENIFEEYAEMNWGKMLLIAGSHRLDYYDNMDFGWGKPRKVEIISIDSSGAICLNGCRDSSQVLEIGISLQREKMEAFSEIFILGLRKF